MSDDHVYLRELEEAVGAAKDLSGPAKIVPPRMVSARAAFEVTAGLIPGQTMHEYTKQFFFTSEDPDTRFAELRNDAIAYATQVIDPSQVNWVRLDWVWF
jgi:hypothetical protein